MNIPPSAFSVYRIGSNARQRLEDYAEVRFVTTKANLELQLGIVCDGVGSAEWGIRASQTAAKYIFDYIAGGTETDIPALLKAAVQYAHRRLYREIQGEGNTTVVLMAVHLNDDSAPNGRLFIASVGDSLIYMVRNRELNRLNIDHNVETAIRRGEMTPEDADGADPNAITRALGVRGSLDVDIGFYIGDSPYNMVSTETAEKRGKKGLKLEAGDTIFACSDGLRDVNETDGKPYLEDRLIIAHALDLDVEKAANTLVSYGEQRQPTDNVSMSLIFIPSPNRKGAFVDRRLPRGIIVGGVAAFVVLIIVGLLINSNTSSQLSTVEQTRNALASAQAGTETQVSVASSYTATFTPTYTPSVTPTPTFTPTLTPTRPAFIGDRGVVGAVYNGLDAAPSRLTLHEAFISARDTWLSIQEDPEVSVPALAYLSFGAGIQFLSVEKDNNGLIQLVLQDGNTGTGMFMWQGQYGTSWVTLGDSDTRFEANAACWSADYVAPDKVALTCFNSQSPSCTVDNREIPSGQQIVWEMDTSDGQQTTLTAVDQLVAERHYERLRALGASSDALSCVAPFVDRDLDLVLDRDDACPDERAPSDQGGINGCVPTSTPTPTFTRTSQPTSTRTLSSPATIGMGGETALALTRESGDATGSANQAMTQSYNGSQTTAAIARTQTWVALQTQNAASSQTAVAAAATASWIAQQTANAQASQTAAAVAATETWIAGQTQTRIAQQTQAAIETTQTWIAQQTQAWIAQQTQLYWDGQTQAAAQQTQQYWDGQTQAAAQQTQQYNQAMTAQALTDAAPPPGSG